MADAKKALLYFVLIFKQPAGWTRVAGPIDRPDAVKVIARQWNLGRMARLEVATAADEHAA